MKKIKYVFLMMICITAGAQDHAMHDMEDHSHEGHLHDTMVDGKLLVVNPERFDNFVSTLEGKQVAIISVSGMVCDFCARGIERTFKKDKAVQKIDVDLTRGKVLVMYAQSAKVNFEDIKQKILSNGQNATDLQIISI